MEKQKTIREIEQEFSEGREDRNLLYERYAGDTRSGVQRLLAKYHRQDAAEVNETRRLDQMCYYEIKYAIRGVIFCIE